MNLDHPPIGHQCTFYSYKTGNNEDMIEEVIMNRSWWKSANDNGSHNPPNETAQLTWKWTDINYDFKANYDYEQLRHGLESCTTRKAVHNFPRSPELDDKDFLFRNLSNYCKSTGLNVFEFVPLTFSFRMNEVEFQQDLQNFSKIFKAVESGISADEVKPLRHEVDELVGAEVPIYHEFGLSNLPPRNLKGRTFKNAEWGEFKLHDTFFGAGSNMWILKPSYSDRGRGIEIFRSLEELERFLQIYIDGYRLAFHKNMEYYDHDDISPSLKEGAISGDVKAEVISQFVIQKYMEKPLLYKGHKLDIRPYVLLNQDSKFFVFREVYGKVASAPFNLDKKNLFGHLTGSVGTKSESYGKVADMNFLRHEEVGNYLEELQASRQVKIFEDFGTYMVKEASRLLSVAHQAITFNGTNKLNPQGFPNVFEIFGFDFLIDESMRCWLLEANGEPGVDDADSYFFAFNRRLIDNLFMLTIDQIFPAPKEGFRKKQSYPFRHYLDDENLWVEVVPRTDSDEFSVKK